MTCNEFEQLYPEVAESAHEASADKDFANNGSNKAISKNGFERKKKAKKVA